MFGVLSLEVTCALGVSIDITISRPLPRQHDAHEACRRFPNCRSSAPACRSDSGSASFLGDVWAAMQEWRDSKAWQPVSVPSLDLQHYEATLAVAGPVELRPPALPERPPLVPDNASPAEVSGQQSNGNRQRVLLIGQMPASCWMAGCRPLTNSRRKPL